MKLIIIRHGETVANVKRLNQGTGPGILTRKGVSQAKKTAEYLRTHKIDMIYCSDLKRAKDTVAEIKKKVSAPVRYVKDLRERDLGEFENLPYGSFRRFVEENGLDYLLYKPEKGESIKEALDRIWRFYHSCLSKHRGKTVLWVSHGGMLRRILMKFLKADASMYKELQPSNCAISIIEIDENNNSRVSLINHTAHLEPKRRKKNNS
jgi:broad specificity phosphatase PhoE